MITKESQRGKGTLFPALKAERTLDRIRFKKKRFLLLAETFQALGDSSRVQIVWLLSKSEYSVGAIATQLSMSQPAVSHHLRTLRNLKLVRVRRAGRVSFYSLDDQHIDQLLQEGMKHVEELL